MANRREKVETVTDFIFLGSKVTVDGDCSHETKRFHSLEEKLWQTCAVCLVTKCIKKQIYHFADKGSNSQSYGFTSSHPRMWELNHKEGWVPNNWCFQIVVLEKTLKSPLDSKVKPVNPKGNEPCIFIERTEAEAEAPLLWPPDAKSWLTGKGPDAGKDWGQEEKWVTEDEMVGWYYQLNLHELEQTPGDSGRQRSLACCSAWSNKLDRT